MYQSGGGITVFETRTNVVPRAPELEVWDQGLRENLTSASSILGDKNKTTHLGCPLHCCTTGFNTIQITFGFLVSFLFSRVASIPLTLS